MKLLPRDFDPQPLPPTSTYTCRVTIAPRVYGGYYNLFITHEYAQVPLGHISVNYFKKLFIKKKKVIYCFDSFFNFL